MSQILLSKKFSPSYVLLIIEQVAKEIIYSIKYSARN